MPARQDGPISFQRIPSTIKVCNSHGNQNSFFTDHRTTTVSHFKGLFTYLQGTNPYVMKKDGTGIEPADII